MRIDRRGESYQNRGRCSFDAAAAVRHEGTNGIKNREAKTKRMRHRDTRTQTEGNRGHPYHGFPTRASSRQHGLETRDTKRAPSVLSVSVSRFSFVFSFVP